MPANLENSAVATGLEKVSFYSKKGNAKECSNYRTIALISHASKIMFKILQARLQQYVNHELPDVQASFIFFSFMLSALIAFNTFCVCIKTISCTSLTYYFKFKRNYISLFSNYIFPLGYSDTAPLHPVSSPFPEQYFLFFFFKLILISVDLIDIYWTLLHSHMFLPSLARFSNVSKLPEIFASYRW